MKPRDILHWADAHVRKAQIAPAVRSRALRELEKYFTVPRGTRMLALPLPGTAFQRAVWKAVRRVPFGQTITYGELARRIGHPHAARAVGTALKKNPIPILIPCHRVVPADGGIGKYAGGEDRKSWLLLHEQAGHSSSPSSGSPRHGSSSSSSS
ncbi:MAG: methylated-DNA--[protein]-cysteine S-methyltransferase [Candidatus Peribacter sp.]|nr:methylated-DNA--[protein]-cysteine S-methyltransferase [Candidatus Peribacter sp.]